MAQRKKKGRAKQKAKTPAAVYMLFHCGGVFLEGEKKPCPDTRSLYVKFPSKGSLGAMTGIKLLGKFRAAGWATPSMDVRDTNDVDRKVKIEGYDTCCPSCGLAIFTYHREHIAEDHPMRGYVEGECQRLLKKVLEETERAPAHEDLPTAGMVE